MENHFDTFVEKVVKDCDCTEEHKEFIEKRAAGARKIQHAAAAKGGPAMLTSIHFKAKEVPYAQSIKHVNSPKFIEQKAEECVRKLSRWKTMSQREFQTVMGQLEAYGESFISLK